MPHPGLSDCAALDFLYRDVSAFVAVDACGVRRSALDHVTTAHHDLIRYFNFMTQYTVNKRL